MKQTEKEFRQVNLGGIGMFSCAPPAVCACGCGSPLPARRPPPQRYLNNEHRSAARSGRVYAGHTEEREKKPMRMPKPFGGVDLDDVPIGG